MAKDRKQSEKPKLYVIRKYVMARSVMEAARKERSAPVHEIFVDEKWSEKNLADSIGFAAPTQEV